MEAGAGGDFRSRSCHSSAWETRFSPFHREAEALGAKSSKVPPNSGYKRLRKP